MERSRPLDLRSILGQSSERHVAFIVIQHAIQDDVAKLRIWNKLNDFFMVHVLACLNSTNVSNSIDIVRGTPIQIFKLSLDRINAHPGRPCLPVN